MSQEEVLAHTTWLREFGGFQCVLSSYARAAMETKNMKKMLLLKG